MIAAPEDAPAVKRYDPEITLPDGAVAGKLAVVKLAAV